MPSSLLTQLSLAAPVGCRLGSRCCQALMCLFPGQTDGGLDSKEALKTDSHRSMAVFCQLPPSSHTGSSCQPCSVSFIFSTLILGLTLLSLDLPDEKSELLRAPHSLDPKEKKKKK